MLIVAIRTIILYLSLLFTLRLMGKSELSKMSPFQLTVIFMIAELAAIPLDSIDASLVNGLIAIFMLTFLQILISFLSTKTEAFKTFISGRPSIIIEKGKLNIEEIRKQRISLTDLLEQLRIKDCSAISEVAYAIIETNGELSIITKEQNFSTIIISDGNLYEENLRFSGMDNQTFENKLRKAGVTSFEDVFLALCDQDKTLHIYLDQKGMFAKEIKI